MQKLIKSKEVKLSDYDKTRFTSLKTVEIDDFIKVYLDKEKGIIVDVNEHLISHLGYYMKYDIEYFIISGLDTEDKKTKKITETEFLNIITDDIFKKFEVKKENK